MLNFFYLVSISLVLALTSERQAACCVFEKSFRIEIDRLLTAAAAYIFFVKYSIAVVFYVFSFIPLNSIDSVGFCPPVRALATLHRIIVYYVVYCGYCTSKAIIDTLNGIDRHFRGFGKPCTWPMYQ